MLSDQTQMQTIVEMDDVHVSSSQLNAEVHPRPRHLGRHSGDVSASSAEDEVKKVNSQDKLQPYSSYKTLSDVKALGDLLDIANTMKSSKSASRSNEALVRKSLHIAGSSPLIQRANNVRPAKSCENLSPPGKPSNIPVIDFSQLSRGPRSEGKGCNGDIVHSGCKAGSDDDLKQNTISTASSIGTLKDVETETETDVKRGLTLSSTEPDYNSTIKTAESRGTSAMLPPLKRDIIENFQTYGSDRSHEDIMRWLHDSADADDVPSDTSEEYRSSIYSSLNDVNSELYSCRSSVSSTRSSRRGKPNDSVLGKGNIVFCLGPKADPSGDLPSPHPPIIFDKIDEI